MKKMLLSLSTLIMVASTSYAIDVKQARKNLGHQLNQTVNELKKHFLNAKNTLEQQDLDLADLKNKINELIETSQEEESNPTVLRQGQVYLPICKNNEELIWKNSRWKCSKPAYSEDCDPNKGEIKEKTSGGGYICKQQGNYTAKFADFAECNGTNHYTSRQCIFKNSKTNNQYQVPNGYCSSAEMASIKRYQQACGPNGANSSCSCPKGTSYKYKNGKGYCSPDLIFKLDRADMAISKNENSVTWGTIADNYWEGGCGVYRRYITFNIDQESISSMILTNAWFDDYIWIKVNGKLIYSGPDGQSELRNVTSGNTFYTVKGVYKPCERSTSWHQTPNIDIKPYLKNGTNRIDMTVIVSGGGEGAVRFNITEQETGNEPPLCEI